MRRLSLFTLLGLTLGGVVLTVLAYAQSGDKAVAWLPADRVTPQSIVIKTGVPDTALVCMEPPTGTVICRPVGMFRKWMLDSTADRVKR
jgi:hypothetical protein